MRNGIKTFIAAAMFFVGSMGADAQYWQLSNQATDMIQTAIMAGARYKGYADVSYMAGVGSNRADVLDISTTQGVKISNAFFMGAGLGVDVMFSHVAADNTTPAEWSGEKTTRTAVMIPLYSDFRLNLGNTQSTSFFADLRLGAAFLTGNRYIAVGNGYLQNSECFYLKPTIGMRVPLSKSNPKLAANVGVSYQLLTNNTWYVSNNSMTLNAIGVNVGIEW